MTSNNALRLAQAALRGEAVGFIADGPVGLMPIRRKTDNFRIGVEVDPAPFRCASAGALGICVRFADFQREVYANYGRIVWRLDPDGIQRPQVISVLLKRRVPQPKTDTRRVPPPMGYPPVAA